MKETWKSNLGKETSMSVWTTSRRQFFCLNFACYLNDTLRVFFFLSFVIVKRSLALYSSPRVPAWWLRNKIEKYEIIRDPHTHTTKFDTWNAVQIHAYFVTFSTRKCNIIIPKNWYCHSLRTSAEVSMHAHISLDHFLWIQSFSCCVCFARSIRNFLFILILSRRLHNPFYFHIPHLLLCDISNKHDWRSLVEVKYKNISN